MKHFLLSVTALMPFFLLWASPQGDKMHKRPDLDGYVDYLPRYRKSNSENFMVTKVEYKNQKTVIHVRYISDRDKDVVRFFGRRTEDAWTVSTPQRGGAMGEVKSRRAEVYNIRLNDRLELEHLADGETASYQPLRGDLLSCEIHFESMPAFIRSINLLGGDKDKSGQPRFACFDLQLKGPDNKMLGTPEQMETLISRFYSECKLVRYPDIKELTSLEQEKKFQVRREEAKVKLAEAPIQTAMEPIDYMPKMLNDYNDLACQERLILQNVHFEDNKAEFTRKAHANRTFAQIHDFMRENPESKIILHGHTDIHGDNYRNLVLSKSRVLNIKRALVNRGLDPNRIITLYYGGSQPLPLYVNGGTMNRRVELEVICGEVVEKANAPSANSNPRVINHNR